MNDGDPVSTASAEVLTPTVRQSTRRLGFWLIAGAALTVLALVILAVAGVATENDPLSPTSPAPDGTLALVEVLREQGVEVTVTTGLDETTTAAAGTPGGGVDGGGGDGDDGDDGDDDGDATLVVHDLDDLLDEDRLAALLDVSSRIVLLAPDADALDVLAPGVEEAGTPDDDPLTPACALPAAVAAGSVSSGGSAYRPEGASDALACLRSDTDDDPEAFSLVQVETDGVEVSVVGATDALTNGTIDEAGNAAFALTLLGERDRVVWYIPSASDAGEVDVAALTPGWVTPLLLLGVATAIAAAFWRGRRFGPLIVEDLPVVVRAAETMEGRARLYQRNGARLHAADALRIGAIGRMAQRIGLPASADVDAVVGGIADVLETEPRGIRSLLVDEVPATDRELVALSDRLAQLEADVDERRRAR